jgi:hypothetical protein
MKYGFVFPGGDARAAAEYAREAEAAGWDGFFVPDAVWWIDPWVSLAAVAMSTERILMGTMITPVSRRRPWKLASETATLDRLSNGRVILSVGLGAIDSGFDAFGEVTDRKTRAELLDEGLEIITGLWKGQPLKYKGRHYQITPHTFPPSPPPVQQPRIPIWVVGAWPREKSMRRVLRYDGLLPTVMNEQGKHIEPTLEHIREMKAYIEEHRTEKTPFDIVAGGVTPGDKPKKAAATVQTWIDAGATWWLESNWSASEKGVIKRIQQGPPRAE